MMGKQTDCFVATFYRFASLDDHVVPAIAQRGAKTWGSRHHFAGHRGHHAPSRAPDSVLELLDFGPIPARRVDLEESSSHGHRS